MRRRVGAWAAAWLFAWLVPAAVFAAAAAVNPGELPMEASFVEKAVETGDVATLALRFTLPDGARLAGPVEIGGLGDRTVLETRRVPGGVDARILVDTLDPLTVGPLTLAYESAEGGGTFRAEPATLSVTAGFTAPPDKLTPRPIRDLLPGVPAWRRWLPWAAGGLAVVLLAGLLAWRLLRGSRGEPGGAPPVPAHEEALARLAELDGDRRKAGLGPKDYYFRLSGILRAYMERLRDFPALEMTVEEIAQRTSLTADRDVVRLLREADLVKFAGRTATEGRIAEDHTAAVAWVRETARRAGLADGEATPEGGGDHD